MPAGKLKKEGNTFLKKVKEMEEEICSVLDSREKEQLYVLEQKILQQLEEVTV